ncbi:endolytic transglycosylase MltG [Galactobacter valiniphilus]|uniref:endolytic transglycosylase MltG n=1 Tax=Galactobacter valiniphilus TaxID=2676122 RepID=UPI003736058D
MSTTEPGDLTPPQSPAPRRRRRRHTPARRFSGVGRHGAGDTAAVEEALALASEAALPTPVPVAAPVDEFDTHEGTELVSWHAVDAREGAEAAGGWAPESGFAPEDDGAWLAAAEEEAGAAEHHGGSFEDGLSRFGAVPAGYLPAEHFYPDEEVDYSDRKRRRRRRGFTLAAIVLVFLLAVGGGGYWLLKQLTAPPADYAGPGSGNVSFTVESGWGAKQIGKHLVDAGVVKSTGAFDAAVAANTAATFHPGDFQLKREMTAADALEALTGKADAVTYFALDPNVRLNAALTAISEGTGLSLDELKAAAAKPSAFGLPESATNLEGWLHPGEYRFPRDADAQTVLQGLVDATKATLEKQGITDPAQQQRTLTIASILMAEALKGDYAKVAGVIENRLAADNKETYGLLQSDATVIYGLDRYSLLVTKAEQQDKSNPFNTYVHKGLPPTPIGSPNDAAIDAAAHPQASDDYYWVTVNLDTGETLFAKTHNEHLANVDKYRQWCQANEGRCK